MRAGSVSGLVLLLALAGILLAPAQEEGAGESLPVEASLDREQARLGEPILLTVTVRHDEPLQWEERSAGGRQESFEIDQVAGPETLRPEGPGEEGPGGSEERVTGTRWVFRVAAFDLGSQEIPEIRLRYVHPGEGSFRFVAVTAGKVEIVGTLGEEEEDPADIRQGFTLPADLTLLYGGLAAALLVVVAAWLLWRRLRGRRAEERPAMEPAVPPRPAYDRYLEALEALLAERMMERGKLKPFHVRISEIVKGYLGEAVRFDAVDRTTQEVKAELEAAGVHGPLRSETAIFLESCDQVKFAKHLPGMEECRLTVARARKILDLGRGA